MNELIIIDGVEYTKTGLLNSFELLNRLINIHVALTQKNLPVKFTIISQGDYLVIQSSEVCAKSDLTFLQECEEILSSAIDTKPKIDKTTIPSYIS